MRLDLAQNIQINDILYNCFLEPLIVKEKKISYRQNSAKIQSVKFKTVDSQHNQHSYNAEDLYLSDLEDEDDIEKAWINWAKNNKDFIDTFDHITTTKEIYKLGFSDGFEHQKKLEYTEWMQK